MVDRADIRRRRRPTRAPGRGGFSFAEVLFAVIILGIGFILVAAIFPVAIQQTQVTVEDAAAAAAARQAAGVIAAVPTVVANPQYLPSPTTAQLAANPSVALSQLSLFPPTVKNYLPPTTVPPPAGSVPPPAIVVPFTGPQADAVRGSLVNSTDPRFAYVPLYRRENGSPVAQLIVIAVTARNRPVFDPVLDAVTPVPPTNYTASVAGRSGTADITQYVIDPQVVTLSGSAPWVTEGCAFPTLSTTARGYRLGRSLSSSTKFELDAGQGVVAAPGPDGLWGTVDDVYDGVVNTNALAPPATVQPIGAYARVFGAAGSIGGRITLSADLATAATAETSLSSGSTANVAPAAAVPGAFVVVADDYPYLPGSATSAAFKLPQNNTAPFPNLVVGALNGRIYRLGQPVPADKSAVPPVAPGTFELDPQYAAVPPGATTVVPVTGDGGPRARVYLVGAGRSAAVSPTGTATPLTTLTTYSGPAQDMGVYTTLFPVQ